MVITAEAWPDHEGSPEPKGPERPPSGVRIPHIRALDGLRGVAVLLVVLSHFVPDWAPGGFLGVDLFFVLSGFLITSLMVAEWESTGRIALGTFWLRRARRLVPALLLVLATVLLVVWLTGTDSERHQVGLDGLSSIFYVANWRFIASGQSYVMQFVQTAPSPLRHIWSLAIEEQFYLMWPMVVAGAGVVVRRALPGRRRALRLALAVVCTVVGVASAAWMVTSARRGTGLDRLYYGTDTRVFMLLAGAFVGAVFAGRPGLPGRARRHAVVAGVVAAGMVLAATAIVETGDRWLYEGGFLLLAVALVLLLVGSAQDGPNPLAWVLRNRALVGLGLISYGVYLWHWPISVWVTEERVGFGGVGLFVLRVGLTLGASLLSYRFVEQPIRRQGLQRLGRAKPVFVGGAVAFLSLGFLVPVLVFPAFPTAPKGDAPTAGASLVSADYAASARCDVETDEAPIDPDRALTVQVIGNSLAGEIRPCLTDILGRYDTNVETVNPPGFLICREVPAIEAQAIDPATRADAAVLFLFVAFDDRCGQPWHAQIDRLIDFYKANDIHTFLVASVTIPVGGREDLQPGVQQEIEYYRQRAEADPAHITAVDAGKYLRDTDGTYVWQMPCATADEIGCRPDGTVPVRFVDGLHFCTDPDFARHGCVRPEDAAGERRAASAIAGQVVSVLQQRFAGS